LGTYRNDSYGASYIGPGQTWRNYRRSANRSYQRDEHLAALQLGPRVPCGYPWINTLQAVYPNYSSTDVANPDKWDAVF
jgi:hypothetical protein